MGKSTFLLKSVIIDKKSLKFDQKSTHFYTPKIGSNLTIKKGDSGSALMLEEKCVIIEAPKSDQKSTQNDVK